MTVATRPGLTPILFMPTLTTVRASSVLVHRITSAMSRGMGKSAFLCVAWTTLIFSGCGNDPHVPPFRTTRDNGDPWLTLYRALGDDPRTLDPQVSYDTTSDAIVSQVYETLLQYKLFETDPYQLEPCLAASLPKRTQNPDGTESYLFTLKRGIRFHDDPCFPDGKGREVTSDDLLYSFRRIADPKVECPVFAVFAEFIPGIAEVYDAAKKSGKADYTMPISGLEIVDRYTLRVHIKKPFPQILYWFAMPVTAPVPREAVEYYDGVKREQFRFKPVGTGAFRLAEWRRNKLIRLVRNDHYTATTFPTGGWPAEEAGRLASLAGAKLPQADEVQWVIIREAIPGWIMFRQGYLDRSGVQKDVFTAVLNPAHELSPEYAARGIYLYKDVDVTTFYGVFNMDDPVIGTNKRLRQALYLAYNGDLANEIFRNGIDLPAHHVIPPGVFGHDANYRNPYRGPDLERARKLLAEAGYPGGIDPKSGKPLELSLDLVADDSQARRAAEFDKAQFEQLGIRINIIENTWARLLDKMQRGQFQIYGSSGWHADYPDPENFYSVFYGGNIPPAGSNHGRYKNPEFDRLYEQMRQMDNGAERLAIIHRMRDIMSEDCPIMPLMHPVIYSLAQPWTKRISNNLLARSSLKYVGVDAKLRAQKIAEWNRASPLPVVIGAVCLTAAVVGGIMIGRRRNA